MSWGRLSTTSNRPAYVVGTPIEQSVVLTRQGWVARAAGNENPAAYEVLVAGNFGAAGVTNEPPRLYGTIKPLTGRVGVPIKPVTIEVVDPDKAWTDNYLFFNTQLSDDLPDGIIVTKGSSNLHPTDWFVVSGTPEVAATGTVELVIGGAGGGNLTVSIPFTFLAALP